MTRVGDLARRRQRHGTIGAHVEIEFEVFDLPLAGRSVAAGGTVFDGNRAVDDHNAHIRGRGVVAGLEVFGNQTLDVGALVVEDHRELRFFQAELAQAATVKGQPQERAVTVDLGNADDSMALAVADLDLA